MERFNGEVRDREKGDALAQKEILPSLQSISFSITTFTPHEALEGRTLSEACGIIIEGKKQVADINPKFQSF
jgi:hypothetical protein